MRQEGKSQDGCFKKTKHAKFSEKCTFLTPWCLSGGKKCAYFGKFGVLFFLETPVLRFALLPYYRRKGKCQRNQWPKARIISIESGEKKVVLTVTLQVADRNVSGCTQIFRRPTTKIVILVGNDEFDSLNRGAQTECPRWE